MEFLILASVCYSLFVSITLCLLNQSEKHNNIWFNNYFKNVILYIPAFIMTLITCFLEVRNLVVSAVAFVVILVFIALPFVVKITDSGSKAENKLVKTIFDVVLVVGFISMLIYSILDILSETEVYLASTVLRGILKYSYLALLLIWFIYKLICYFKAKKHA